MSDEVKEVLTLETERTEKERQKRIAQARIDRLLRDAAAFQQAGEIRKYIEAIRSGEARNRSLSMDQIERWTKWALAQADRIDPTISGRFLKAMQDGDAD
jgi:hypothetical protein